MTQQTLRIPARFNGPPASGHGGYSAGRVAALLGDRPVEVTLHAPPPLETELRVERDGDGDGVRVLDGETVVASARPADGAALALTPPGAAVEPAAADAAAAATPLRAGHPFPTCFGCGFERPDDDGLGCLPGPLGDGRWAVGWTPSAADPVLVWAALDCPSSAPVAALGGPPHLLGRLALRIDRLPAPGAPHAIVSWALAVDGRKKHSAAALLDGDGALLAVSRATWIELRR